MNAVRFKFQFNAELIEEELQSIPRFFKTIYSAKIKEDKLIGIHLINSVWDGKKDNEGNFYRSTSELDRCPYLQSVLNTFKCDKINYRVHNLRAKGKIELHRDLGSGLANKIVRIHIPVTTNEEVYFYVNEERICMKNGECWFADITQYHEVENRSNEDRLQLMIDCDLNDWWKNILKEYEIELKEDYQFENHSVEELELMKENIILMNNGFDQTIMKKINLGIIAKTKK